MVNRFDLESADLDDLVAHYLPERVPKLTWEERLPGYFLGLLGGTWVVSALLALTNLWSPSGLAYVGLVFAVFIASSLIVELSLRQRNRAKREKLQDDLASGALIREIADRFREDIQDYRRRMLGSDSEWAQLREPLAEAKNEANRAVSYWEERVDQLVEPDVAEEQLGVARELEVKFGRALTELDQRAEVLRGFFNRCEAKLSTLEMRSRDREESQRLLELATRADSDIQEAAQRLELIGEAFAAEALEVGSALSGLQRFQVLEDARHVDVGELEAVADRVLEIAMENRSALDRVRESLVDHREAS